MFSRTKKVTSRLLGKMLVFACALIVALQPIAVRADGSPDAKLNQEEARRVVDRTLPEVESIRGLDFVSEVPVEVIDDDRARAHVLQRIDSFELREQLEVTSRVYSLLSLLPPGFDALDALLGVLREQAGGFYDPAERSFYLLDDMPESLGPMLVAHELTHALEDQHFDLDARLREVVEDDDRMFARSAVHEGSATLLMTVFLTRGILTGEIDPAAAASIAELDMASSDALEKLPPVLLRQLVGPYVLGAAFLTRGKMLAALSDGFPASDANRAYEDGPESSEQILHPGKYWSGASRDDPISVDLDGVGRRLGKKWKRLGSGVLGELSIGPLVGAQSPTDPTSAMQEPGEKWTNAAASGWGGDRWELWERNDAEVLLVLTVWDTDADAAEFAAALPAGSGIAHRADDRAVALVAGDAGAKTDRLLDALLARSPVVPERQTR